MKSALGHIELSLDNTSIGGYDETDTKREPLI